MRKYSPERLPKTNEEKREYLIRNLGKTALISTGNKKYMSGVLVHAGNSFYLKTPEGKQKIDLNNLEELLIKT